MLFHFGYMQGDHNHYPTDTAVVWVRTVLFLKALWCIAHSTSLVLDPEHIARSNNCVVTKYNHFPIANKKEAGNLYRSCIVWGCDEHRWKNPWDQRYNQHW
jgi:hypothetical protein